MDHGCSTGVEHPPRNLEFWVRIMLRAGLFYLYLLSFTIFYWIDIRCIYHASNIIKLKLSPLKNRPLQSKRKEYSNLLLTVNEWQFLSKFYHLFWRSVSLSFIIYPKNIWKDLQYSKLPLLAFLLFCVRGDRWWQCRWKVPLWHIPPHFSKTVLKLILPYLVRLPRLWTWLGRSWGSKNAECMSSLCIKGFRIWVSYFYGRWRWRCCE